METWYFCSVLRGFIVRSAFWVQFLKELGDKKSARKLCACWDLCNGVCLHPKLAGWWSLNVSELSPVLTNGCLINYDQVVSDIRIWKTLKNQLSSTPHQHAEPTRWIAGLCHAKAVGCRCKFGHASLQRGARCLRLRDAEGRASSWLSVLVLREPL